MTFILVSKFNPCFCLPHKTSFIPCSSYSLMWSFIFHYHILSSHSPFNEFLCQVQNIIFGHHPYSFSIHSWLKISTYFSIHVHILHFIFKFFTLNWKIFHSFIFKNLHILIHIPTTSFMSKNFLTFIQS